MARPQSDIRPRIERAAREQFLSQGVDGASLRAIAAEAGTNIGMVYYYFETKEDLFLAVVSQAYGKLLADAQAILGKSEPVPERLRKLYERIWTMSADEFAVVRLVLREAMISAERVRRLGALFGHGHVPILLGALGEGIDEGSLRDDLPPPALLVCTMALGMMPMIAWRVAGERLMPDLPLPPPDALAEMFSGVLLRGLAAPSATKAKRRFLGAPPKKRFTRRARRTRRKEGKASMESLPSPPPPSRPPRPPR